MVLALGPAPAHASIAEERKVGDEVVKEVRHGLPLITDWEINDLVTSTGRKRVAVLGTLSPERLSQADEIVERIDLPLMRRLFDEA